MKAMNVALIAAIVLITVAVIVPVVSAVPLIEVPGAYLDPPDAFLINDPIVHEGVQNGYILEITTYTREKYLGETSDPKTYMGLHPEGIIGRDFQSDLAFKKLMYPYTEKNPQNWYPGWEPTRVGFILSTNAEVTGS